MEGTHCGNAGLAEHGLRNELQLAGQRRCLMWLQLVVKEDLQQHRVKTLPPLVSALNDCLVMLEGQRHAKKFLRLRWWLGLDILEL